MTLTGHMYQYTINTTADLLKVSL